MATLLRIDQAQLILTQLSAFRLEHHRNSRIVFGENEIWLEPDVETYKIYAQQLAGLAYSRDLALLAPLVRRVVEKVLQVLEDSREYAAQNGNTLKRTGLKFHIFLLEASEGLHVLLDKHFADVTKWQQIANAASPLREAIEKVQTTFPLTSVLEQEVKGLQDPSSLPHVQLDQAEAIFVQLGALRLEHHKSSKLVFDENQIWLESDSSISRTLRSSLHPFGITYSRDLNSLFPLVQKAAHAIFVKLTSMSSITCLKFHILLLEASEGLLVLQAEQYSQQFEKWQMIEKAMGVISEARLKIPEKFPIIVNLIPKGDESSL